jgi:hypothetical protein
MGCEAASFPQTPSLRPRGRVCVVRLLGPRARSSCEPEEGRMNAKSSAADSYGEDEELIYGESRQVSD